MNRKSRRVRPFRASIDDGFVRNEPVVAPATQVPPFGVGPSGDVRLVRVRNPDTQAIERSRALFCQMENILVTIRDVTLGLKRLEVAGRDPLSILAEVYKLSNSYSKLY